MARIPPLRPELITTSSEKFTAHCPACGMVIDLQATVDAFGSPNGWHFWGVKGERWQRCKGEQQGVAFVHFRTLLNGRFSERIAWLRPAAVEPARQHSLFEVAP